MRLPRASGVLLHPTSLPGPHGSGDLGREAFHFVDWLVEAGQQLWQVLPLAGIGPGDSPYMSNSAFAGNPLLVDLRELQAEGWLDAQDLLPVPGLDATRVDFAAMVPFRMERLARAAARFAAAGSAPQRADFERFRWILAMDEANLEWLRGRCPAGSPARLGLLLDHAPHLGERAVPDPYYGPPAGFERVLDLVEAGCDGFVAWLLAGGLDSPRIDQGSS